MSENKPEDRPSLLAKLAPHIKSTIASDTRVRQDKRLWEKPEHRKNVKAMHERAKGSVRAQFRSSLGYVLRHFLQDYNNR